MTEVVVAQRDSQARQLWCLRESIPAAEKILGSSQKHDVCVPLGDVAAYMAQAQATVLAAGAPVGDGDVHLHVHAPPDDDAEVSGKLGRPDCRGYRPAKNSLA